MTAVIVSGGAHPGLARDVAAAGGFRTVDAELERLPDAELVGLATSVRGEDVYLVQPTPPPPEAHVFELLLLADAARRAGASRVTGVIPYLGYSRQDRRAAGRRVAIGARMVADLLATRLDRVIAVDLHAPAIEGFFSCAVEHLEAFPLMVERVRGLEGMVVVAPDLGAAHLADRYALALDLPFAVVHKTRLSGTEVAVRRVTGEVAGRVPLIVDDMITTGRTVAAALNAVIAAGARPGAVVAATHGVFAPQALDLLFSLPIRRLLVTDSVAPPPDPRLEIVTLAGQLADAIGRLHDGRSLEGLLAKT
jgi:ribose-phosphate pyrophosphokinase